MKKAEGFWIQSLGYMDKIDVRYTSMGTQKRHNEVKIRMVLLSTEEVLNRPEVAKFLIKLFKK